MVIFFCSSFSVHFLRASDFAMEDTYINCMQFTAATAANVHCAREMNKNYENCDGRRTYVSLLFVFDFLAFGFYDFETKTMNGERTKTNCPPLICRRLDFIGSNHQQKGTHFTFQRVNYCFDVCEKNTKKKHLFTFWFVFGLGKHETS